MAANGDQASALGLQSTSRMLDHANQSSTHKSSALSSSVSMRQEDNSNFVNSEEPECRVCRGEAEDERPLFAPCLCSGSIRFIHQDCLLEWLSHSGKEYCELCSHRFKFTPLFAVDAPDRVPFHQIVFTLLQILMKRWVPSGLRISLVVCLWLVAMPWTTCWLYRLWMLRSGSSARSSILERINWTDAWSDGVSGIIIAMSVIFSFLSLMSFADFLRFHWEDIDELERNIPLEGQVHQRAAANLGPVEIDADDSDDEVEGAGVGENPQQAADVELGALEGEEAFPHPEWQRRHDENDAPLLARGDGFDDLPIPAHVVPDAANQIPVFAAPGIENNVPEDVGLRRQEEDNAEVEDLPRLMEEDELEHVELNIAVDELLGLRGPIINLFRNLVWLLAFNGAYLGLFVFIPFTIGCSMLGAATSFFSQLPGFVPNLQTIQIFREAATSSFESGDALQAVDMATTLLGYVIISGTLLSWQLLISMLSSVVRRPFIDGIHWALDCMAAMVKVSSLLALKMVVLPIVLGWGGDLATISLFGVSIMDRVTLLANHMLGTLMVHWVIGISGMLFVTVSVLQLREVLHPFYLASIVRPQEAHPDLMKTLLSESCARHARRMIISLTIYAVLLLLLIYLPARLFTVVYPSALPFKFHFSYICPEIQLTLELVVCHMTVLSLLEKYKNDIGTFQHAWMRKVCGYLGLVEYLLPRQAMAQPTQENAPSYIILAPPPLRFAPAPREDQPPGRRGFVRREAWPEDPQEALEVDLLPRTTPPLLGLRLLALSSAAWITIVTIMILIISAPLALGRGLANSLKAPDIIRHDPYVFSAGFIILCAGSKLAVTALRSVMSYFNGGRDYCLPPTVDCFKLAGSLVLWTIACPIPIGVVFDILQDGNEDKWNGSGPNYTNFSNWLFGFLLLEVWSFLVGSRILHVHLDAPQDHLDRIRPLDQDGGHRRRLGANQQREAAEQQQLVPGNDIDNAIDGRAAEIHVPLVCALGRIYEDFIEAKQQRSWAHVDANFILIDFAIPLTIHLWGAVIIPEILIRTMLHSNLVPGLGQTSVQILWYRTSVLAFASVGAAALLSEPFKVWMGFLHDTVRNERFLIGRQLMDR